MATYRQISLSTIGKIQRENLHAFHKHGAGWMGNPDANRSLRLSILVEEIGEVAKALNELSSPDELIKELIQVATMAACWIDVEEHIQKYGQDQ